MSIQIPPDSTGKTVETNAPNGTDQRQVVSLGDTVTAAAVAKIQNADPGSSDYGITVRNPRGNAALPVRVDPTGTTVQPVSASALPLPTGAATAAKQPALGTAGTASADVITVQGIASMTALKVDGSAVTQPVSGGVVPTPSASVTATSTYRNAALSNTAVAVKASSGRVYYMHFYNSNTADIFLHFYDVAQGSVTVGTTTPTRSYVCPAGGVLDSPMTIGVPFATAITLAATTTAGGGTAPTTALLAQLEYI